MLSKFYPQADSFIPRVYQEKVNPSTPRPKGRGLPSTRVQAEGSGFTLSGVFHFVLKDGASRRRTGENIAIFSGSHDDLIPCFQKHGSSANRVGDF